jgi:periplasmic divalent cation tolerance protein
MHESDVSFVYVTAPDMGEAESLAEMLVENQLAACVNILPGMRSVYRWQGRVEREDEVVLVAKTRSELVDDLTRAIADEHSHEVPCVVSWPIENGHPDFLDWVITQTAGA